MTATPARAVRAHRAARICGWSFLPSSSAASQTIPNFHGVISTRVSSLGCAIVSPGSSERTHLEALVIPDSRLGGSKRATLKRFKGESSRIQRRSRQECVRACVRGGGKSEAERCAGPQWFSPPPLGRSLPSAHPQILGRRRVAQIVRLHQQQQQQQRLIRPIRQVWGGGSERVSAR